MRAIAHDVFRHRIALSYEAQGDGKVGHDDVTDEIIRWSRCPEQDGGDDGMTHAQPPATTASHDPRVHVDLRQLLRWRSRRDRLSLLPRQPASRF